MEKPRWVRAFSFCSFVLIGSSFGVMAQTKGHGDADPHYKVLHNFQGKPDANGNFDPEEIRGLAADGAGTIYGESVFGGSVTCLLPFDGVCLVAPSPRPAHCNGYASDIPCNLE